MRYISRDVPRQAGFQSDFSLHGERTHRPREQGNPLRHLQEAECRNLKAIIATCRCSTVLPQRKEFHRSAINSLLTNSLHSARSQGTEVFPG